MAHSFLIFNFGGNEDAAQQARHKIDGWKQGFRLDKKLQLKFERQEPEGKTAQTPAAQPKAAKSGAKGKAKSPAAKSKTETKPTSKPTSASDGSGKIRLIVRLDFSDHEKLSHQRWIERIPMEEPFKTANPQIIKTGDPEFTATSDLFDSLD